MINIHTMTFPEYIEKRYLEWQQHQGKRKSIEEFAAYIGVSQPTLSLWLSGKRLPGTENIKIMAELFGFEIYDALGMPRPDPDLHYIQRSWDDLSPDLRRSLREQAEKYKQQNESKRIPEKRRTRTS